MIPPVVNQKRRNGGNGQGKKPWKRPGFVRYRKRWRRSGGFRRLVQSHDGGYTLRFRPGEWTFSDRVRIVREERKIGLPEFSRTTGIARSRLTEIECGDKSSFTEALAIAGALPAYASIDVLGERDPIQQDIWKNEVWEMAELCRLEREGVFNMIRDAKYQIARELGVKV